MSKRTGSPVDVPIPRTAVLWLLGSQLLSLWLHATHLPVWLWAVVAFVLGWRWLTHLGRVSYPDRRIKTLAVIAASVAVFMAFERRLTLESASAFLIAASSLKLLEMKVRRDGYVVGYLSFFVLGTGFLFDQGILSGLYGVLAVWCLTTALVTLHGQDSAANGQTHSLRRSSVQAGRLAGGILLVSLPMMLVLYLLFPRMGPLWSFTLQSGKAKSGLSEEMAAGDIVDLSQSDELAFRVSFSNGQLPAREQLYWRALVLDYYDGRRWLRQSGAPQVSWFNPSNPPMPAASNQLEYEIVQEATDKNWLFALTGVRAAERGTGHTSDNRLVARRPVFQRQRYLALFNATAMVLLAGIIARFYSPDPQVVAVAAALLMYAAVFQLSDAVQIAAAGALRAYHDTFMVMVITFIAYWLVGLGVGYWLAFKAPTPYGAEGFWTGLILGLTTAAILLTIRLRRVGRTAVAA